MDFKIFFGVIGGCLLFADIPVAIEYSMWVHPSYHRTHRNLMIGMFIAGVLSVAFALSWKG